MAEWRQQRAAVADEAGFTLIELLLSMSIFALIVGLLFGVVVRIQRYTSNVAATADAASELRQAIAQIDRQVRSGNVLYSPANEPGLLSSCTSTGTDAGSCMRIYTQANGLQRCVQWQVTSDPAHPGTQRLRSRSWSPDWQTDDQYAAWTTQARGLTPTPTVQPFTLMGAASTYSSRYLSVVFDALDPRRTNATVRITDSLSGRNTNYGYDAGVCSPEPPEVGS